MLPILRIYPEIRTFKNLAQVILENLRKIRTLLRLLGPEKFVRIDPFPSILEILLHVTPGRANIQTVLENDFFLARFACTKVFININMQPFGHGPFRFRICFRQLQFSLLLDRSTYLQYVRIV